MSPKCFSQWEVIMESRIAILRLVLPMTFSASIIHSHTKYKSLILNLSIAPKKCRISNLGKVMI